MPANRLLRKRKTTVKIRLPQTPADWLLAQYDVTGPDYIEVYDEDADELMRPACIQPMFMLKSPYEPGESMRVTASDYGDNGRWWL
jgi:hypothetical protein